MVCGSRQRNLSALGPARKLPALWLPFRIANRLSIEMSPSHMRSKFHVPHARGRANEATLAPGADFGQLRVTTREAEENCGLIQQAGELLQCSPATE